MSGKKPRSPGRGLMAAGLLDKLLRPVMLLCLNTLFSLFGLPPL